VVWVATPIQALLQTAGLIVAWSHGCLGLHFWLRLKPWYEKAYPFLYTTALILPILALTGFLVSANEVEFLARDTAWQTQLFQNLNLTQEDFAWAYRVRDNGLYGMIAALGLLLLSRLFWFIHFRKERLVTVHYPEGRPAGDNGSGYQQARRHSSRIGLWWTGTVLHVPNTHN